ncbi:MAG: hypothetical protein K6E60_00980 [Saccharofermentans sp.]|nr:hypothetical protein [Saccharofermentans sp.]
MEKAQTDNSKRIAKNTLFLYFRMMLIMAVSLYASRVTLKVLGVDDFGIYQTVGGAVSFLTFLSNALGTGTSRFITFEMGKEKPRLGAMFATVRVAHIILAAFVVIAGEAIGLWFIYNKLVIPPERLKATVFAFHFSMAATFFQITQVPYNASIIAHEKMDVYAYISILEAVLKLVIVYALLVLSYDKLEVYSVLMFAVTIIVLLSYRIYCRKTFEEVRSKLSFEKGIFKEVAAFSGWNLLSSSAASLANQGVTVVTNMFFDPAVITVRTLALKVNDVMNQFVGNFRTAVNPQIVKKYAAGDQKGSKKLALASAQFTYYLMLALVLPLFLLIDPALKIWLEEVPEGLPVFVRLALLQALFQTFDNSFYIPIYAKGQIKENAIISPLFDFLQLPAIYILFKIGFPPVTLAWVQMIAFLCLGVIIKPVLVHIIVKYSYKEMMLMILRCLAVTLLASAAPYAASYFLEENSIIGFITVLIVSLISVGLFVWFAGIDKQMKSMLIQWIKGKSSKDQEQL